MSSWALRTRSQLQESPRKMHAYHEAGNPSDIERCIRQDAFLCVFNPGGSGYDSHGRSLMIPHWWTKQPCEAKLSFFPVILDVGGSALVLPQPVSSGLAPAAPQLSDHYDRSSTARTVREGE